jgi:hypothetical protein
VLTIRRGRDRQSTSEVPIVTAVRRLSVEPAGGDASGATFQPLPDDARGHKTARVSPDWQSQGPSSGVCLLWGATLPLPAMIVAHQNGDMKRKQPAITTPALKYGPTELYGSCEVEGCAWKSRTTCSECGGDFCREHTAHSVHARPGADTPGLATC